jgi:hypothetical protein
MENHASTSTAATQIKLIAQMLFLVSGWSRGSRAAALREFAFALTLSPGFDPLPLPFSPFFFFFAIM